MADAFTVQTITLATGETCVYSDAENGRWKGGKNGNAVAAHVWRERGAIVAVE